MKEFIISALLPKAPREPPYDGAKDMILIENAEEREFLKMLFNAMFPELPSPKYRKKKG